MSAPEIFLTWVAARTSRIRICARRRVMPFNFNHPARVAERIGMLDTLSGGRLDVGAARGGTLQETSLVGADIETTKAQVEEALRILGAAWQKDELEYNGELMQISPHPILPRPVQTPHPPLFLACSKQPSLVEAANMGVGALVLGFAGPDEVANLNKIYRDAIDARDGSQFVSTVQNNHLVALCPTIVSEDGDTARQVGARGQRFFAQSIAHWFSGGKSGILDEAVVEGVDHVKEIQEAAEQQVAMLHEAKIPVTVNATATYNINHAYGTRRGRDRLRAEADRRGCGRDHAPHPDGHRPAGGVHGDHPHLGREGHPALPRASTGTDLRRSGRPDASAATRVMCATRTARATGRSRAATDAASRPGRPFRCGGLERAARPMCNPYRLMASMKGPAT
ncbi:LLM class flavin-dependent oxidoreductase [Yinghuangia aomiensis]